MNRRGGRPLKKLVTSRLFVGLTIAVLAVGAIVGAGLFLRDSSTSSASPRRAAEPEAGRAGTGERARRETTTTTAPTTTTATTTTTTVPPPVPVPAPPAGGLPEVGAGLRVGSSGPVVQAYEQRLADLHFDPGPVDGRFDASTQYAVQGLQKLVGADRTGRIANGERFALAFFQWPKPMVAENPEPDRVEIDVARQVLVLYQGYQVRLITPVSTGSGVHYCYTPKGQPGVRACEYALTPSGRFTFKYFKKGWDKSPLGQLYNPYYFNGGIAVHGYSSVPIRPASHGCVRIPMYVSEYFHDLVVKDEPVYVFNGADHKSPVTTSRVAVPAPTAPPAAPVPPPDPAATTAPPAATTPVPPETTAPPAPPETTAPPAPPAPPG